MQTDICVLQHGNGKGAALHLTTGLDPARTIETLARSLDDTRPIWDGAEKITTEEQTRREGRFASSLVAHYADEVTGGNIRDAAAMGDFLVTGYPSPNAGQSVMVDPVSQRIWVGEAPTSLDDVKAPGNAMGFDDFVTTAKNPKDLASALGFNQ